MHTGFFFKLWDQRMKSEYQAGPETCLCAKCCRARGERTREAFEAIEKPDYSVLLSPSFWWHGGPPSLGGAPRGVSSARGAPARWV
jgi:lathosterol oxidase